MSCATGSFLLEKAVFEHPGGCSVALLHTAWTFEVDGGTLGSQTLSSSVM